MTESVTISLEHYKELENFILSIKRNELDK